MFFLYILKIINSLELLKTGYYMIDELEKETTFTFNESNIALFIFLGNSEISLSIYSNNKFNNITNFKKNSLFIQSKNLLIHSNGLLSLIIWIIPYEICPRSGYYLFSSESISFNLIVDNPKNTFCLFPVPNGSYINTISYIPRNDNLNVNIFDQLTINDLSSPYSCISHCEISKKSPFFIQIKPLIGIHSEFSFYFEGKMHEKANQTCTVESIEYSLPESSSYSYAGGLIHNLQCGKEIKTKTKPFNIIIVIFGLSGCLMILFYAFFGHNILDYFSDNINQDEGYLIEKLDDTTELEMIVQSNKISFHSNLINNVPKFL